MKSSMLDNSILYELTEPPLRQAFEQNAAAIATDGAYAVALSAGPDSAMLAVHAAQWARVQQHDLYFFHIHHGLQTLADTWAEQAAQLGHLLGVPTWVKKVRVEPRGDGIESAARRARYEALEQMATALQVQTIFLGHHLDDQAETVLMRLLRGSGPTGMQAMRTHTQRHQLWLVRPFLGVARELIIQAAHKFSQATGWQPVTDPTNLNPIYQRGIIREELVPVLDRYWPQWRPILGRHAQLAAEESQLLNDWAAEIMASLDFDSIRQSFSLIKWRALPANKQRLVLRYLFQQAQLPMPSQARLAEMQRQLQTVHQLGTDRQLQIQHAQYALRCLQGQVLLQPYEGGAK